MQEKDLSKFMTLSENPNSIIKVYDNTNLMYIKLSSEKFIAREFVRKVEYDGSSIEYIIDYEDIIDGKIILTLQATKKGAVTYIKYLNKIKEEPTIIPLSKLLNVRENTTYYMQFDDIKNLIKK